MSYTQRDYDDINIKIECAQSELNRNEREQSNFIARFGKESEFLLEQHDRLCDEMDKFIQKRHEIAKCLF